MTDKILSIPGELVRAETRNNGAVRLTYDSQENIPHELIAKMFTVKDVPSYMAILPEMRPIEPDEVDLSRMPTLLADKDERSPAMRLRSVLYVMWEQKGKPTDTFNSFYETQMERFIGAVKEKLT